MQRNFFTKLKSVTSMGMTCHDMPCDVCYAMRCVLCRAQETCLYQRRLEIFVHFANSIPKIDGQNTRGHNDLPAVAWSSNKWRSPLPCHLFVMRIAPFNVGNMIGSTIEEPNQNCSWFLTCRKSGPAVDSSCFFFSLTVSRLHNTS